MMQRFAHRLEGLEPDNFLAFMALLGLLRALETEKPDWRPRAYWDVEVQPWRPVLSLTAKVSKTDVAEAAANGTDTLANSHEFGGRTAIDFTIDEAEQELKADGRDRRALFECLIVPAAYKDDGKPIPTPYCLMFGQGHQHFLPRFSGVPRLSEPLRGGGKAVEVKAPQVIAEALFAAWRRGDATDAFRWDPEESNRYALRAKNPSGDPEATTTQHGANRLAAVALPLLPACAITRKGKPRTLAVGAAYDSTGDINFAWPIWSAPATVAAVIALMRHPAVMMTPKFGRRTISPPTDVKAVMRSRRISLGKLMNVSFAHVIVDV